MAIGSVALTAFRPPSQLWKRYNAALQQSPLQTKALTCATAYAVGDVAAQLSSSRCKRLRDKVAVLDVARTCRMAMFGLMWTGCVGHYFYTNLDKVMARHAMKPIAEVAAKVGIDQLTFSPAASAMFYVWINLASNTLANIPDDIGTKLIPTVKASWAMWVPAMTVNMALVPAPMRILFINAAAIAWTLILSSMASGAVVEAPAVVGDGAFVPLLPEAVRVGEAVQGAELCLLPHDMGTVGELLALGAFRSSSLPQDRKSSVLRDMWEFMRGSEQQPRRSSKTHDAPSRNFLQFNIEQASSGWPFGGLGMSRTQSFATGNGEDAGLDAVLDEACADMQPPTPGTSDAGLPRPSTDLGGLPVDPLCDCLS